VGARRLAERRLQRVGQLSLPHTRGHVDIQADAETREYFEITHNYPLAAARAFSTLHPSTPFTFVYVSGEGATQTPGMFTPIFGRVKGQTETSLFEFGKENPMFKVYNMRAGAVDWLKQPEIHPFLPKLPFYRSALIPGLNVVYKSLMLPTGPMGKVFTELAMSKGEPLEGEGIGMEGRLVSNVAIRRMGGL